MRCYGLCCSTEARRRSHSGAESAALSGILRHSYAAQALGELLDDNDFENYERVVVKARLRERRGCQLSSLRRAQLALPHACAKRKRYGSD